MFDSFRIRSFRYQWSADAVSVWASEMENLVLGWYIIAETGSAFQTGLLAALRFGGTLIAPLYGVMADRMNRRKMLVGMRLIFAGQAAVMMALALTGALHPWHAFVLSFLIGLVRQGEQVVRQSLIADTVPRDRLMNATGLARTTQDLSRMAGSFLGAGLLSQLGLGQAYIGVTCFFFVSALLALGITLKQGVRVRPLTSPMENLRTGASYMRRDRTIVAVMFLAFLVNFTTFPLTNGLLPVVAKQVFDMGPTGLATLTAVTAVGALVGSLAMAAVSSRAARPDRLMIGGIIAWHVTVLAFSQVHGLGLALLVLSLYGAAMSFSMVTMSTLLLETTEAEFRGRVMGVRMLAVYGLPMGLLLGGVLSDRYNVQTATLILGLIGIGMLVAALVAWPELWRKRPAR
ncbi:MAG: MFS transporter [Dehalococcoidia bacterium]|nr:MFS transporter [Dehalococcoidia bacterium]